MDDQPYPSTAEDRAWRLRRLGYYALQIGLFFLIGFRIGPNLILFHSPVSPSAADFVRLTERFVPMIAAIKAYNRDYGKLPVDSFDMPPEYGPPNYNGPGGEILDTTSITFPVGMAIVIEYEFSPEKEGWIVHSPRYDGPIPAPIVTAAPKPTTRAATSQPGNSNGQ